MIDWYSQSVEELAETLQRLGEPSYRSKQLFRWLHQRGAQSFDGMSDLGKALRQRLEELAPLTPVQVEQRQTAEDGTVKFLMRLADGRYVESVLMRYSFGYSLCISSQVGCRMGCRFCASTLAGLERNLTAGEMAQQIYAAERDQAVTVSHVVVMGCGEPFDNYDQLLRFLDLVHHPLGKGMSLRHITVSTCGLTERIRQFADTGLPVTLAISLHAPNDTIRRQIMRVAQAVSMEELKRACQYYVAKTNKRITFEYILIRGLNDEARHARELAAYLQGLLAHVNLIPVNPVAECGFQRPTAKALQQFQETLEACHVPVTLRREMGQKIDAACGQLRAKAMKKGAPLAKPLPEPKRSLTEGKRRNHGRRDD